MWAHGNGGNVANRAEVIVALAARGLDVVAFDYRGYGKSGGFDRIANVADMAFHYVELFDALGLDEVYLAGHSMGGWVTALTAARA